MRHMYIYIYTPFEIPLFITIDVWQVIFLEVDFGQETTIRGDRRRHWRIVPRSHEKRGSLWL